VLRPGHHELDVQLLHDPLPQVRPRRRVEHLPGNRPALPPTARRVRSARAATRTANTWSTSTQPSSTPRAALWRPRTVGTCGTASVGTQARQ
jgi:hypothetical protein